MSAFCVHADNKPNAIRAEADIECDGPLRIKISESGHETWVTVFTRSITLAELIARGINGAVEQFYRAARAGEIEEDHPGAGGGKMAVSRPTLAATPIVEPAE